MDRILEADACDATFRVPADFDPDAYIEGGRVYRADEEREVRVRYSARIARWIAEREEGEWDEEGGFTVAHRVVDPHWLVRHVLQYGPDAVVLEPEEAREWVRGVVNNAKS
jgi:predicted DNA-binding transcriptional regulator YafY